MTQVESTQNCPRGHLSTEADYCSECGARIAGAHGDAMGGVAAVAPRTSSAGEVCPDCATPREQPEIAFCEVCGFNFQTGSRGEIPALASPPPVESSVPAENAATASASPAPPAVPDPPHDPAHEAPMAGETAEREPPWSLFVQVDPTLKLPESPEPPDAFESFTVPLGEPVTLIGRVDEVRGIFPEVALTYDEAVSRRHALLQWDRERGSLLLRDIGASNGTRLNGTELVPMTDHALEEGDEITLGHWSRLRVQRH